MNEQKGRRSRRSYSILRGRFTPRSEPHQPTAERLTQLCGAGAPFRLLSVAPFLRSLFRDAKTSLSPLAKIRQNNRVSIGKTPSHVNPIHFGKTCRAEIYLTDGPRPAGLDRQGGRWRLSQQINHKNTYHADCLFRCRATADWPRPLHSVDSTAFMASADSRPCCSGGPCGDGSPCAREILDSSTPRNAALSAAPKLT